MHLKTPRPPLPALPALLVAATLVLAGCAQLGGEGGSPDAPATLFDSFQDALDAPSAPLETTAGDGDVRVRLLEPTAFQALPTGAEVEVVVLVYDQRQQDPVADADVSLLSATGGTLTDLTHDAHGVYVGTLTLSAPGEHPAEVAVGLDDGTGMRASITLAAWTSADDAMEADGLVFDPVEGAADVRLKLLHPAEPLRTEADPTPFTFLLLDADGNPVEGAGATIGSWMPPHGNPDGDRMPGHGTHSEVAPDHARLGIYQGQTNHVMNGTWWVNVTVTLADGSSADFRVTYDVGTGSHGHDGMDGGDGSDHDDGHGDHSHAVEVDSFLDAMAGHGPVLHAMNGSHNLTFKLVHPEADAATQGEQDVLLVLGLPEAGRAAPVPMAHVEFDIHKHAHGGGTVHANTTQPVHAGHGVWHAVTNLTEDGTWSVHAHVTLHDGSTFDVRFHVEVGAGDGGHDHGDHEH